MKREPDPIKIPKLQYSVYGYAVDKETYLKHLSTFGTPNQMTLEEVKKHEIVKPAKKCRAKKNRK